MDSGSGTTGGGGPSRPPFWRKLEESCKGLGSVTLKNKQSTHLRISCLSSVIGGFQASRQGTACNCCDNPACVCGTDAKTSGEALTASPQRHGLYKSSIKFISLPENLLVRNSESRKQLCIYPDGIRPPAKYSRSQKF